MVTEKNINFQNGKPFKIIKQPNTTNPILKT